MVKAKSVLRGNTESPAETTGPSPILDLQGKPIDPIWAAEFRGFFWGEGTIALTPSGKGRHSIFVHSSIGLRSDDAAVLRVFKRRLGGVIRIEPYRDGSDKTITRWQVSVAKDNLRVARLLGEGRSPLRFLKARQLRIWRKCVDIKVAGGAHAGTRYTPKQREFLLWAHEELKRMRKWAK